MAKKKAETYTSADGTTEMKAEPVQIKKLDLKKIDMCLFGTSSLIMHAWSAKAKKEMLDKQMKKAKTAKSAKDPEQDFKDSIYYDVVDGMPCFPSVAFKASAVNAAIAMGMKKTDLRQSFHVTGEMVPIYSAEEPNMREDMVRIGMGVADIRYRGEFAQWGTILPITINTSLLSVEQLTSLFDAAGFGIGVGEWRPQRDGAHGMFKVADNDEMALVRRWQIRRNAEVEKKRKEKEKKKVA